MKLIYSKIVDLLVPAERKKVMLLLWLMVVGMVMEMLGIGLVVPVIALLTQENIGNSYPFLQQQLNIFGEFSHEEIVIGAMFSLTGVYLFKNLFLAFLVWQQTKFAYDIQASLSQRLYILYLRQPYTFHLQRNSAQLIRNIQIEVTIFATNTVRSVMQLFAELLVLGGLCALMLVVELVGTLIVMTVMSVSFFGFHYVTKKHVTRWGEGRQFHEGMRIQHLHQGLGGVKDVKILGRENDFFNKFG
ncbi:ABC transporter ATP-binding protein, partial [bacterium]|nr:ABC transporter ATP-binding protein [bacterium]